MSTSPAKPLLSPEQLERLAKLGDERQAAVGDVLFKAGDRTYPFIVILEGEVAIQDPDGHEIIRHGASGFLGEINLLSGQTVYLTAVVTEPTRYIAIDREQLRPLLSEDGALSTIILTAFNARREMLQARAGLGLQIIGPRNSERTRAMVDFARRNRLPFSWSDTELPTEEAALALINGFTDDEIPLVRIPAGPDLRNPSPGEMSRTLGIGLQLEKHEEVDLLILGGGPGGLGAAVYGASEGLSTLVVECTALGGQAGTSRLIENYLGFPAGISGSELTMRAITQARKFSARSATPYKAVALEPGTDRHVVRLEDDYCVSARAIVLATGAEYRRLPVADLEDYEGSSVFYAAGPPEARLCGAQRVAVVGGGNSAAQAAIWLTRGGAVVTLLHRRASLKETMSDYLIHDLARYNVAVRDNSEIAELHGHDGKLEAVTLKDGERLPFGFLFLYLGAAPCTDWLNAEINTDEHGFVLTGPAAGAERFLETNVPGVFAVGDVRSGSVKRCATAVGEGAMAVSFVHEYLSGAAA